MESVHYILKDHLGSWSTITDSNGNEVYRTEKTTPLGQTERFAMAGDIVSNNEYHPEKHTLTHIYTTKGENILQNLRYDYDGFGNLAIRKDETRNLEEHFGYDHLNRLKTIRLGNLDTGRMEYDPYGRMTKKVSDNTIIFSDARYDINTKPHAIDEASCGFGIIPEEEQNITYTCFDKVKTITEGDNTLAYIYGYDRQRIFMEEHANGVDRTKRYVGSCEFLTTTTGRSTTTKALTYLTSPTGIFAVVETEGDGKHTLHYVLKDHLGSWTTITDAEGNVEQELSFDAWGCFRDPETWCQWETPHTVTPMFDRGYTGHEHMTAFGLINMNGRCYDPLTSHFLSVDAYVQDPSNAQAFNRYAYCAYNPLRYTDPTGWSYCTGPGNGVNPNLNTGGHTQYHSDDPNDVLWGRSVHPGGNSSSGYINGVACTSTGYAEGNNGLQGSNYTVDKKGYVNNKGINGMTYDILYTEEAYESGDLSNGLIVNDLSILAGLTKERPEYWAWSYHSSQGHSGNYTSTEKIDEAFMVYDYLAQNTNVEWSIDGYRTNNNNEYVIATMHEDNFVTRITVLKQYSIYNQIFRIHSHPAIDGTKGAGPGDMTGVDNLYKKEFYSKDIHQWFIHNGQSTIFPKHYVYHKYSSVLYYYVPNGKSNIFIRKINNYKDLYRNLGF